MPTYEYKCSNGHHYEMREGFDAPSRQPCPTCGAEAKRVLFPPPIVFKGSGFYVTDSRKGSTATVGEIGGGAGASPASNGESAGSSDSATKTPASAATDSTD